MTAPLTLVSLPRPGRWPAAWCAGCCRPPTVGSTFLEPVLGKGVGYYEVRLAADSRRRPTIRSRSACYFAADFDRVLAIDPSAIDNQRRAACSSVLFPRHASGSLRSGPLVVGPYLVLVEGSDLDHTRLRAWPLSEAGFADPDALPLAEQTVSGWSWFAPQDLARPLDVCHRPG